MKMMIKEESSCDVHQSLKIFMGFSEQAKIIGKKYCGNISVFKIDAAAGGVEFMTQIIDKQCKE